MFTFVASAAGFTAYFSMYAFRRPWAAASYKDLSFFGVVELKTALDVGQVVGYALSKFIGIKICSEAEPGRRATGPCRG